MFSSLTAFKHSGKLGISPILMPLLGLPCIILLSYIYVYAVVYIPIAGIVSLVLVISFSFGIAFTVLIVGKLGKCRNNGFFKISGFLLGLFGLYFSWVLFLYVLLNRTSETALDLSLLGMFLSPDAVWALIQELNSTGWYAIKGTTVSGVVLWVFWAIEALVVVGWPTVSGSIEEDVFCEFCDKWCAPTAELKLADPKESALKTQIAEGDFEKLLSLAPVGADVFPRLKVYTLRCDQCCNTASFSLKTVSQEVDKDGKATEKTEDLSKTYLLSRAQYERLMALAAIEPELAAST